MTLLIITPAILALTLSRLFLVLFNSSLGVTPSLDTINVLSLHLKQVTNVGSSLFVSARADDNVIEALEYKDNNYFIVGVQYHPELDDKLIFERFINEVKKRHV